MSIPVPLEGFGGGGGASLNFDVKAYATEETLLAAVPKENTIGVITQTAMTSWAFSATEPAEPVAGMVWISTGNSSGVEFNALKKNAIQVYPLSAKQYVDGAWVDVTAMSYQGGEWVEWVPSGALYHEGYENTDITGGWGSTFNVTDWNNTNVSEEAATKNEKSITIKASSEYTASIINTKKAIDATPYKTLTVDIDVKSGIVDVLLTNTLSGSYTGNLSWVVAGKQNLDEGTQTVTVDLSGVNRNVYIVILGIKGISSDQTAEATITIVTLR